MRAVPEPIEAKLTPNETKALNVVCLQILNSKQCYLALAEVADIAEVTVNAVRSMLNIVRKMGALSFTIGCDKALVTLGWDPEALYTENRRDQDEPGDDSDIWRDAYFDYYVSLSKWI